MTDLELFKEITNEMVEAEAKNAAQKLVDEAKAKLPKGEAKTQEQLIKEFVEKNGKTDVEALLKRKIHAESPFLPNNS